MRIRYPNPPLLIMGLCGVSRGLNTNPRGFVNLGFHFWKKVWGEEREKTVNSFAIYVGQF